MFRRDLSLIGWDEVKRRQLQRSALGSEWIQITGMACGMQVIDIGPGPGVFTRQYARTVGESGRIFAVEKSPEAIEHLRRELQGLANVEVLLRDAEQGLEGTPVPDMVMITDVLHHTESPAKILGSVYSLASSASKVLIAEFNACAEGIIGPPLAVRIKIEDVVEMALSAGFLVDKTGTQTHEHYYVLLRKPA